MKAYFVNILVALSQLLCTLFGGWPDESTSSYLWRLEQRGRKVGKVFRPIVDRIFFWHKDHCKAAYESERSRYHLPPLLRGKVNGEPHPSADR